MSIKIFKNQSTNTLVGQSNNDGLIIPKNRRGNFAVVTQAYIASTSTNTWHSNVQIYATNTSGLNVVDGSQGYGVKIYTGSLHPTERLWDDLPYGNKLRINNIGTSGDSDNTYRSLWIYTDIPSNSELGIYPFEIVIKSVEHPV